MAERKIMEDADTRSITETFRVARVLLYSLRRAARTLFQRLLNRLRHLFALRFFLGRKTGDDLSVAIDQEFVEVPADVAGEFGIGLLAGEEFVERVNVAAFDRNFGEHRERDFVFQR